MSYPNGEEDEVCGLAVAGDSDMQVHPCIPICPMQVVVVVVVFGELEVYWTWSVQDTVNVCLLQICTAVVKIGKISVVCVLVYIIAGVLLLTELQRSGNGEEE